MSDVINFDELTDEPGLEVSNEPASFTPDFSTAAVNPADNEFLSEDEEGENEEDPQSPEMYEGRPTAVPEDDEIQTIDFEIPQILDYPADGSSKLWTLKLHSQKCVSCGYLTGIAEHFPDDGAADCHYTNGNHDCPTGHIVVQYINVPKTPSQIEIESQIARIEEQIESREINSARERTKFIVNYIEKYETKYPKRKKIIEALEDYFFN